MDCTLGRLRERYAAMLAANTTMKESIRKAHKNGVVIYGECGGDDVPA